MLGRFFAPYEDFFVHHRAKRYTFLRMESSARGERYRIGDLVLDVSAARLTRGEESIPLQRLTFDLLRELAWRHPKVAETDDLIQALWPDHIVGEENGGCQGSCRLEGSF